MSKTPFKDMLEKLVSYNDELRLSLGTVHRGEEPDGFHYRLLVLYQQYGYKEYKRCSVGFDKEPTEEDIDSMYYSIISQIVSDSLDLDDAFKRRLEKKKQKDEHHI